MPTVDGREMYEPEELPRVTSKDPNYIYKKRWRERNPEKSRSASLTWYHKTYQLKRIPLTKDPSIRWEALKQRRLNQRMKKFPEAQEALQKQKGLCAICGKPEMAIKRGVIQGLSLDHNHKTGQFRGWLCVKCNTAVGMIEESIEILHKMEEYLGRAR